jgi:CPA2 family monovalent cation:H+ antiporter-2
MLTRHGIAWVAADRDMRLVENGRHAGHPVWFGDAARADFLRHIGLETARAVIVTLDDARGAETIVACARQMRPDVPVVARARDAAHARRLYRLGATDVVLETIDASLQLSAAALRGVGVPSAAISESVEDRRDLVQRELREPAAG